MGNLGRFDAPFNAPPPSGRSRLGSVALALFLSVGSTGVGSAWAVSAVDAGIDAPPVLDAEGVEDLGDGEGGSLWRDDPGELRLQEVKSGRSRPLGREAIHLLRAEALKESALVYGARAGLYARTREIHRMLDEEAPTLDQNFPFASLILSHNMTPPVLQEGRNTVRQHHDAQLQFADAVFHIVAPAKLAVTPPHWRTYLYVRVARPEPPDETLWPDRSQAAEVDLWERSVERGWRQGVRQADRTFAVQLNRLERDLRGMALYRELLAKGMVTAPRLTEQLRGVTTHGPTLMVNDRLLEITENTRFVADDQRWKPYPTRPYRPPKPAPPIHLRVLEDPPTRRPVTPIPTPTIGEPPLWDR